MDHKRTNAQYRSLETLRNTPEEDWDYLYASGCYDAALVLADMVREGASQAEIDKYVRKLQQHADRTKQKATRREHKRI